MVFTIVTSIRIYFQKTLKKKQHENGHLAHYDSFRGGGSHISKMMIIIREIRFKLDRNFDEQITSDADLIRVICRTNMSASGMKSLTLWNKLSQYDGRQSSLQWDYAKYKIVF